jgi:predicted RNA-binding Zn ribbon-like protein
VQRFLNTLDSELGTDALANVRSTAAWLRSQGFRTKVDPTQREMLLSLREALRAVVDGAGSPKLDVAGWQILAEGAARTDIGAIVSGTGRIGLVPTDGGTPGFVSALFLAMHDSEIEGAWSRLRICRRCRWAFFDVTKNNSAAWCTIRCRQRAKAARYYQRTKLRRLA